MDQCLPQEMSEAILGKLDRETLCTARLVSRTFCAAASANITSLTFKHPCQAVSLERFCGLGRVSVHINSSAQLDPRLRAVITHLTYSQNRSDTRILARLPEFPGMPKLRELEIKDMIQVDGAEVLLRLTTLEVLRIGDCTPQAAMTITMATWLTSLVIGGVTWPWEGWRPEDASWLQNATNLKQLQDLEIDVPPQALPLIGNLTGLTGLTWWGADMEESDSIAPLSRLSRLRSLEVKDLSMSETDLAIACSLGGGSLANLQVQVSAFASDDCGRLLARQTALTRLAVSGAQLCNLRHMGGLRMELLQSLELQDLGLVEAEGLEVLQRATSLTELCIASCVDQPDLGLSHTLARLTHLRSLKLEQSAHGSCINPKILGFCYALSPLTTLTELRILLVGFDNGDLRALLGSTGLQVLELRRCCLTDDVVPELAVLTNLRSLTLKHCGVTSLAPATNIINPLRQARGWPPVDACCV